MVTWEQHPCLGRMHLVSPSTLPMALLVPWRCLSALESAEGLGLHPSRGRQQREALSRLCLAPTSPCFPQPVRGELRGVSSPGSGRSRVPRSWERIQGCPPRPSAASSPRQHPPADTCSPAAPLVSGSALQAESAGVWEHDLGCWCFQLDVCEGAHM